MSIVVIIIAAIVSAVLYRLGGMSKEEAKEYAPWKWFPRWMVHTKARDIGCMLTGIGVMLYLIGWNWAPTWKVILAYVFCAAGTFGALTTYWDELFGYDNFWFHGFMIGLAKILFAVFGGISWLGFGIQLTVCAVGMGLVSKLSSNVYVEECGRGAIKQLAKLSFLI